MANKPKRVAVKDRRARVEELRRQQQAAERRKTVIFIMVAGVVALGILAAAVIPLINESQEGDRSYSDFGVSAAAAQCDPVANDAIETATHVDTGAPVAYATVPPSGGDHWNPPSGLPGPDLFTADDRPQPELLVHNLEHGYTILWYDSTITGDQLNVLRDLADRVRNDEGRRKFIVTSWDDSLGAFPEGKHIALTHWSREGEGAGAAGVGRRQLCGQISGEVVDQFMTQFPFSDAPEPNAV